MSSNEERDTPYVRIDLEVVERNLARMQQLADRCGVQLRPHIKTHKSIYFANAQLKLGAVGVTVAKLGEAEILAQAGISDILVAYPLVGAVKLARLAKLLEKAEVTVVADQLAVAQGLSELGLALNRQIPIYIEIDTGLHRIGRQPGEDAVAFAKEVQRMEGLRIIGIMSHGGHCYGAKSMAELEKVALDEAKLMVRTQEQLIHNGIPIRVVSLGASPTSSFLPSMHGVTEIRPGTYIFNDYNQVLLGAASMEDCAVRIETTVISRPAPNRIAIDAGSKTLTSDMNVLGKGYGWVASHPDFHIERLSEEHGLVSVPEHSTIAVGDRIEIIPNHVCPVINLFDEIAGVRGGSFTTSISIDARGKNK